MRRLQLMMLGFSAGIAAAGCAGIQKAIAPMKTPDPMPPSIRQIGYGPNAGFSWCSENRCPTRTVKTLATVEQTAAAPVLAPATVIAPAQIAPATQETHKTIAVTFETGSARLSDEQAKVVDAAFTQAMHIQRIVIRGRTDATGSARGNDRLAGRRAEAVRDYLLKARHDTPEITLDSKGSCCYAGDNRKASGRAANRRVEVEVFFLSHRNPPQEIPS